MVTGDLKNQIDRIWDTFWSGGISNPIDVIEQMTFLLFLKRLDELHTAEEKKAARLGREIDRPIFTKKNQKPARWSAFKQLEPNAMYEAVRDVAFIREHENHIAIQRLRMNEPLTPSDVAELERLLYESSALGTKTDFEHAFGTQRPLGEFIRSIVGVNRETAQGLFAEFLDGSCFSARQIRFVQQIIEHLTRNGVMDPALLYEAPYTDADPSGVDGLFGDEHANQIIGLIQHVNQNARVRGSA